VRVFRICRKTHAKDPLSGRGALRVAGRWHSQGVRVVYASASRALAALEVLVHVDADLAPDDLVRIEIDLPGSLPIETVKAAALAAGWRAHPAPESLRAIGDRWIRRGTSPVLRVPSAVVPEESNYLLNPAHAEIKRVSVVAIEPFAYDARLFA
jgi:RES domain-containing protein